MEECLKTLEESKEHPDDLVLVQQVRMQLICETVNQQRFHDGSFEGNEQRNPTPLFIKTMEVQLQKVKDAIPAEVLGNRAVMLHYWHTQIKIHEVALVKSPDSDYQRIDNLFTALKAIKNWHDLFYSITAQEYTSVPFSIFSQCGHSLTVLLKLAIFEDPAWDQQFVRHTVDLTAVTDNMLKRMQEAADILSVGGRKDEYSMFIKGMTVIQCMRAGWASKFETDTTQQAKGQDSVEAELPLPDPPLQLMDDEWFSDMITLWDGEIGGMLYQ
jgi:hypothetical protein